MRAIQSPVPDSLITIGFDEALPVTETAPDFAPLDFGEKVTLIVQFALAATLFPHVEVMPNWPTAFIEEIFRAVWPVLLSVTVCGALVVPTLCFLKFSGDVGEKETTPVFSSALPSRERLIELRRDVAYHRRIKASMHFR